MPLTDAEAKARLSTLCDAATAPALSSTELDTLVQQAKRIDGNGTRFYAGWEASRAYAVGDLVAPDSRNGFFYEVTVAGDSHSSAPTWPTEAGETVVDGEVTWAYAGADAWVATFDLNAAAAEGWRLKAGKAVPMYDASVDDNRFNRAQIYAHCIEQADYYAKKVTGTARVRPKPPDE